MTIQATEPSILAKKKIVIGITFQFSNLCTLRSDYSDYITKTMSSLHPQRDPKKCAKKMAAQNLGGGAREALFSPPDI